MAGAALLTMQHHSWSLTFRLHGLDPMTVPPLCSRPQTGCRHPRHVPSCSALPTHCPLCARFPDILTVTGVFDDGPAWRAGVRVADRIRAVNGRALAPADGLATLAGALAGPPLANSAVGKDKGGVVEQVRSTAGLQTLPQHSSRRQHSSTAAGAPQQHQSSTAAISPQHNRLTAAAYQEHSHLAVHRSTAPQEHSTTTAQHARSGATGPQAKRDSASPGRESSKERDAQSGRAVGDWLPEAIHLLGEVEGGGTAALGA